MHNVYVYRYWSAGLSAQYNGGRYFTFLIIAFAFNLAMTQIFRSFAFYVSSITAATPMCGIFLILTVLFSGFIQPFNQVIIYVYFSA